VIGIIATHIALAGKEKEGVARLQRNGRMMSEFPGFRERFVLVAKDNPLQISTFTIWDSLEDMHRWRNSDARKEHASDGSGFWAVPPRSESFKIVPELDS
jgi:heme-degrading monooxygenase HmoA